MIVIADILVMITILVIVKIFDFFIIFIILVIINIFIIIIILVFTVIFNISFLILFYYTVYMAVVRQFGPQLLIKSSIKSIFRQRDILPKILYLGITLKNP